MPNSKQFDETNKIGTLVLVPNFIANSNLEKNVFTSHIKEEIQDIKIFFCEKINSTVSFLKKIDPEINIDDIDFKEITSNSSKNIYDISDTYKYLSNISKDKIKGGLHTESGYPCIADPGEEIVLAAHSQGIFVKSLLGTSSISMALAQSGLNGEKFIFHGYFPISPKDKKQLIHQILNPLWQTFSHLFIEAPFRNQMFFDFLLQQLPSNYLLHLSSQLLTPYSFSKTMTIENWKKNTFLKEKIHKVPTIFIIQKG